MPALQVMKWSTLACLVMAAFLGHVGLMLMTSLYLPHEPLLGLLMTVASCILLAWTVSGEDLDEPDEGPPEEAAERHGDEGHGQQDHEEGDGSVVAQAPPRFTHEESHG